MEQDSKRKLKTVPNKTKNRLPLIVIGAVLLIYLGAQVFSAFSGGIQTVTAARVTVNDSFFSTGWFFRQEVIVSGSASDTVQHIVYSGERVQQNAPLAVIYADEQSLSLSQSLDALNEQIALLDLAIQSAGDGADAAKLDQLITLQLQQLAAQLKSGAGAALSSSVSSIRTLSLRRSAASLDAGTISSQRDALVAQRDSLSQQLSGRSTEIAAPSSGYFSEIVDGYEGVLTIDSLDGLTPARLDELAAAKIAPQANETLGKIVQGFTWYVAAEITAEQAARLKVGQNLRVSFTQASIEVPVTVSRINKERDAETAILVLEGDDFSSEMVSMRDQPIEIILGTYTGLKVPKEAAGMQDGQLGVFILSGSMTRFKTINPLYETDSFYVVQQSATDAKALVAQDQIVIRGKDLQNNMVVRT